MWFMIALGVHAAILFATTSLLYKDASYDVANSPSIDVDLVESAAEPSAAVVSQPLPTPPEPVLPPVTPPPPPPPSEPMKLPEPTPPVEQPKPELPKTEPMVEPEAKPEIKPEIKPEPPKPVAKSRPTASASKSSSSPSNVTNTGTAGSNNVRPSYLFNPPPPYPPESKASREQGLVLLSVSVNEQGQVSSLTIKQSSGYPRLDAAARTAVQRWKFKPARVAGLAMATVIDVPVRFRLGAQ